MAEAPLSATSGSWWDYVPGASYLWPAPASIKEFSCSVTAAVAAFKDGMYTFKVEDEKLGVSKINPSYRYTSLADDLRLTYKFTNLSTNPTEKVSVYLPIAPGLQYTQISKESYRNLFDYVCRYNNSTKGFALKIQNSEGTTDYSKVDIVFKSKITLTGNAEDLEKNLNEYKKTAASIKAAVVAILSGKEPPKFEEDIGEFVLVPNVDKFKQQMLEKEKAKKAAATQPVPSPAQAGQAPPPIGLTAELLNSKRSNFEAETAKMPLSKFKQHYEFVIDEVNVVTGSYNTASKVYNVYFGYGLAVGAPGRVNQEILKGYQKYAATTHVVNKGKIVLELNLQDKMFNFMPSFQTPITTNPNLLNKQLNDFFWTAQNIRLSTRVFA